MFRLLLMLNTAARNLRAQHGRSKSRQTAASGSGSVACARQANMLQASGDPRDEQLPAAAHRGI
jgi:hypothetical protein